jgi:hypothetical protein
VQEEHQGIRYLEHCITAGHAADTAIHNYLLSLYVDTNADDRLERFVTQACTHTGRWPAIHFFVFSAMYALQVADRLPRMWLQSRHYDRQYALRLCTQRRKLSACVQIYEQLGLLDEAVECALKVDVDLAKVQYRRAAWRPLG